MRRAKREGKYNIIYIDPPWGFYKANSTNKLPYPQMSNEELLALPWKEWIANECMVFCWVTCPGLFLDDGCGEFIEALKSQERLHYRGETVTWIKTTKEGVPLGAIGTPATTTKPIIERIITLRTGETFEVNESDPIDSLLCLSTAKTGRPLKMEPWAASLPQTLFAPRREHSRKPEQARVNIESMFRFQRNGEPVRRLEVFARETRDGWDVYGNETEKFNGLD